VPPVGRKPVTTNSFLAQLQLPALHQRLSWFQYLREIPISRDIRLSLVDAIISDALNVSELFSRKSIEYMTRLASALS
jgi:hypothetical protein